MEEIRAEAFRYRDLAAKNDSIFPSFASIAGPALATVGAVGDILSRPAYGLSEAYGEFAEGGGAGDVLEGLGRGLTGGYEEAEHPTFGERIVPVEEDEGFGRKVARFGADVVTDPTMLLGGPVVKGLGRGALAAGRAVKGTKAVQRFAQTDLAQSMSRGIMGTDYNIARYGGEAGDAAVKGASRGVEVARNMSAPQHMNIEAAMKTLGVKANDDAFWTRVTKHIEGGDFTGKEGAMARVFRREYDFWDKKLASFKDEFDDVFETFNPMTGETAPYISEANYAARYLKPEIADQLVTKRGASKAAEELAEKLSITRGQADRIIKFETGQMKKAGKVEYARIAENSDVFDQNALRNFVRYSDEVSNRYAMAREFGIGGGKLKSLMQGAEDAGLSKATIETFTKGVNKRFEPSPLADIAPALLGWQVLTKLGPTSVIAQFGQHVNIMVQQGVGKYVKGLMEISTDPRMAQQATMAVKGQLKQVEQLLGRAGAEGGGSFIAKAASKYLGLIGFKRADAYPRAIAFAGGIATAKQALTKSIRSGVGWSDDIGKQFGISKVEFNYFAKTGKFPPATESRIGLKADELLSPAETRIGLRAAKSTQFEPDFLSLPPMWQSPEMRVAMQFRSFIHEQSRFLWKGVMEPAIKYIDTKGTSGSVKPMMRALVAFPIAGQGVAAAREFIREISARVTGAKRNKRYKRKFDYDHPLAQLAKDSLYVGAFGIGGDILEQASRGNLLGWIAGPTITDVAGLAEGGLETMGEALGGDFPGFEDAATFGAKHMPGRRLLPLTPRELGGAARDFPPPWMER